MGELLEAERCTSPSRVHSHHGLPTVPTPLATLLPQSTMQHISTGNRSRQIQPPSQAQTMAGSLMMPGLYSIPMDLLSFPRPLVERPASLPKNVVAVSMITGGPYSGLKTTPTGLLMP